MSAELAARRTAAAAVLGDFRQAVDKFIGNPTEAARPDFDDWAWRLAWELRSVLQRLEAEDAEPGPAELAEVRKILGAFDWETGDRQYALEAIDVIVNRSQS